MTRYKPLGDWGKGSVVRRVKRFMVAVLLEDKWQKK